ncbi:MAG TPA: hypothetical protein VGG05_28975 [Pseudonocardiaceae bacterium]
MLVVSGTLAGVGWWRHSIWLVGIAMALLLAIAVLVVWRTRR